MQIFKETFNMMLESIDSLTKLKCSINLKLMTSTFQSTIQLGVEIGNNLLCTSIY